MRYINRLEAEIDEHKEHIVFLETLLEILHGEEWSTLTASKAQTLTTIPKHELKESLDELKKYKTPETYKDITNEHLLMVNDIIEVLGEAPAYSQKAKDILLKIKSKASIRTMVVLQRGE